MGGGCLVHDESREEKQKAREYFEVAPRWSTYQTS
jgi:hypothetical protein